MIIISRSLILTMLLGFPLFLQAADNYFLCNTPKGTLSLADIGEQLVYEMNNHRGNVFKYISKAPEYSGFLYNRHSGFQTNYMSVSFVQSGYKYVIISYYENGSSERGVTVVDMKTKKNYFYECQNYKIDKLFKLSQKLQCDTDNAVGCYK